MAFELAGFSLNYLDLLDKLEDFAILNGWTTMARTEETVSATVTSGGALNLVNDVVTLITGTEGQLTGATTAASFTVASIDGGGGVLTVTPLNVGQYHHRAEGNPATLTISSNPLATEPTLNVVYQRTDIFTPDKRLIMRGDGSGSDEIFVGYQADDFSGVFGWRVNGFTGFQPGTDYFSQPGISPYLGFVPLNNGAMTHWFFVNPSRIMGVYRIATTYTNSYTGFVKRFGTATDFPYPLCIIGTASQVVVFSNTIAAISGMNNPMYHTTAGSTFGPGQIRTPGGQWISLANSGGALSFFFIRGDAGITPPGRPNTLGGPGSRTWDDFFKVSGGAPNFTIRQTPDTTAASGFRFPLIPCMVYEQVPQFAIHGELDNVYYSGSLTEAVGQATVEDIYNVNGDDYILFQNGNRTDHWTFFWLKVE